MTFYPVYTKLRNIKTNRKAIIVDTLGLDYRLSVLNADGNKSRKRWVTHEQLETQWTEISHDEYWEE